MEIIIAPNGIIRCIYEEAIDLARLGEVYVYRASRVDPTIEGLWLADLSPVGGPVLGPFATRRTALQAELLWLQHHWLTVVSRCLT